jgi:hypothetical protein
LLAPRPSGRQRSAPKDTVARKPPTSPPSKDSAAQTSSGKTSSGKTSARPAAGSGPSSAGRSASSRPQRTDQSARKARVAQVQKAQKSRERRTVLMIITACAVLVLLLGGVITYGILDARKNQPENLIVGLGTPAASASCDAVTTDAASGNSDHVGPGTNRTDVTKVAYATVPPTSGSHFVQPVLDGRQFYSSADTPRVETLVHNLEHGYTVLWYLPSEESARSAQLQELASLGNKLAPSQAKFIVAPWNEAYGQFPSGKKFALSHWSATTDSTGKVTAQAGHRQLCGDLSGEAVKNFVTQFPKTDAPEPLGA